MDFFSAQNVVSLHLAAIEIFNGVKIKRPGVTESVAHIPREQWISVQNFMAIYQR